MQFFVNADQLGALSFLMPCDAPELLDRIINSFPSFVNVHHYVSVEKGHEQEERAIIGNFDIAARTRMPADLLSFALPYAFLERMAAFIPESFFTTHSWHTIKERI